VLVGADLCVLFLTRAAVRLVRDHAVLGRSLQAFLLQLIPPGSLSGVQFATAVLFGLALAGNYGPGDRRHDVRRLLWGVSIGAAFPFWAALWSHGVPMTVAEYLGTTLLFWALLTLERATVHQLAAHFLPESESIRTLVVGSAPECEAVMASSMFSSGRDYHVAGFVDVRLPAAPHALGHVTDFVHVLQQTRADAVVVCGHLSDMRFHEVVDAAIAAGTQILAVPRSAARGVTPNVVWLRGRPLIQLTVPTLNGQQLAIKRALDICIGGVLLALAAPLIALIALCVKLTSPGAVVFRQERVGRGGKPFSIFKFRTMVDGADRQREQLLARSIYRDARLFKVPDDPRVTAIGKWLRLSSLDELPQLVNVLRGEMSLVGPRPPLPSEVALYERHHYARFSVIPGITGPWQVAGRNGITDFEQVVKIETEYIRTWSLARDLAILARTIPVVLGRRGAH